MTGIRIRRLQGEESRRIMAAGANRDIREAEAVSAVGDIHIPVGDGVFEVFGSDLGN
jgi:hypothetical protein